MLSSCFTNSYIINILKYINRPDVDFGEGKIKTRGTLYKTSTEIIYGEFEGLRSHRAIDFSPTDIYRNIQDQV
jgi:hypothetical protein